MKSGIYCIENLINSKKYIGKTVNINKRWNAHKRNLNNNIHKNKHLQNAWYKYGGENFKLWAIEECEKDILSKKEIYWIEKYKTNNPDFGYNMTKGGGGLLGYVFSEETKIKISNTNKGKNLGNKNPMSKSTRKKLSKKRIENELSKGKNNPMFGKHHSDEAKKKMGKAKKGKYLGKNNPLFGKHLPEETRLKISISQSGEKNNKAKLKKEDVTKILDLYYNQNFSTREIFDNYSFGICQTQISGIVHGKQWIDVYNDFVIKKEV
jgi:group I intron endonuclease